MIFPVLCLLMFSAQTNQEKDLTPPVKTANPTSCTDSSTPTPTIDLSVDDGLHVTLAETIAKGKRRFGASKSFAKDSSPSSSIGGPVTRGEQKLLRAVKQEKLT